MTTKVAIINEFVPVKALSYLIMEYVKPAKVQCTGNSFNNGLHSVGPVWEGMYLDYCFGDGDGYDMCGKMFYWDAQSSFNIFGVDRKYRMPPDMCNNCLKKAFDRLMGDDYICACGRDSVYSCDCDAMFAYFREKSADSVCIRCGNFGDLHKDNGDCPTIAVAKQITIIEKNDK